MSKYTEIREAFITVLDGKSSIDEIIYDTGISTEEAKSINKLFTDLLIESDEKVDPYRILLAKIDQYLDFLKPALVYEGLHNACTAEDIKRGEVLRSEIISLRKRIRGGTNV